MYVCVFVCIRHLKSLLRYGVCVGVYSFDLLAVLLFCFRGEGSVEYMLSCCLSSSVGVVA